MKTSTLIFSMAIIGAFITLTSINLRLKKEYTEGRIHSALIEKKLPPFFYIKDMLKNTGNYKVGFEVVDQSNMPSSVAEFYDDEPSIFSFKVVNDTLYIQNNPLKTGYISMSSQVTIHTSGLKGISSTNGSFHIIQDHSDNMEIIAVGQSAVGLTTRSAKSITIKGDSSAIINLSVKDTINSLSVNLMGASQFNANNLITRKRSIQIEPNSSIRFMGRSIEDFGVKRN